MKKILSICTDINDLFGEVSSLSLFGEPLDRDCE